MTNQLGGVELPRPASAPDAGPLDEPLVRPGGGAGPAPVHGQPDRSPRTSASTARTTAWATARRDAVLARDRRGQGAPRGGRGARPRRPLAGGPLRARPRAPQRPRSTCSRRDEVRRWERRSAGGRRHRRRRLRAVRARRGAAGRAPRAHRGPPRGGRRRTSPAPKSRAVGPQVAHLAAASSAATPTTCRGCSPRSVSAAEGVLSQAGAAPACDAAIAAADGRSRTTATGSTQTLATATDDWPLGRERYDELVRLRAFGDLDADAILEIGWEQLRTNPRRAPRRRPRAGPGRGPPDRHRAPQGGPPGHVRGGARRLQRRDAPGPRLPHRARPRHRPGRRAHRGDRRRRSTCAA